MANFDAILVLGGGVREGGQLPSWAAARFDLALELRTNEPVICLSAATTHRPPPLDSDGFPILESAAGAQYLIKRGVSPDAIRVENASYDTIGNAYFAKLMHIDPEGWRRLLVVTSEFHMPRTRAIFDWIFGFEPGFELTYHASADRDVSEEAQTFRRRKEAESLRSFLSRKERFHTLREVHHWIFTGHSAYSAAGGWKKDRSSDPQVLASY